MDLAFFNTVNIFMFLTQYKNTNAWLFLSCLLKIWIKLCLLDATPGCDA